VFGPSLATPAAATTAPLAFTRSTPISTAGNNNAVGAYALANNISGNSNTANGYAALYRNTTGDANTANGAHALLGNTTGGSNTATGAAALTNNTTGNSNTANGVDTLALNTTGGGNTANGSGALFSNATGIENTANGVDALTSNTIGIENTADGVDALVSNTTGQQNTATGWQALLSNTTGVGNTANGGNALVSNTTGSANTANGQQAFNNNTSGSGNVALGVAAGSNATTGDSNVYIGAGMIDVAGESNACYIASIFGQTSASGIPVLINASNKLGTTTSSKRFKEGIKPMDKASETILALKPVTFRYKKEIDPAGTSQFGLVAEEVEKVNPDLVVRDREGKPYSVRYDQVNAMLLNEFLKEHRKNEEQEATIAKQQKQIEALTMGLQKVTDQLELSKAAPRTVGNNQ